MQTDKNTLKILAKQIARLGTLPGFPSDAGSELMTALTQSVVSVEHAQRVIDSCMESCQRCPVPMDIRRVAVELRPAKKKKCAECGGDGYIEAGVFLVTFGEDEESNVEPVTQEQEIALRGKLKCGIQGVYEAARECPTCNGGVA